MKKELWTIDDIIKDYEDKGIAGRSKIEFLESVRTILDGRLITTISVPLYKNKEEYEKLLQTIKDQLKEKLYIPVDYSNPGPTINEIYLPKKYLKWEDLKFSYGEWNKIEVYLGNEKLGISYKSDFDFFDNSYEVVKIYNLKTKSRICKIYDRDKQFFNNLHLEVIENE